MEQKELSKLRNDETVVIKPAVRGEAIVTLSTGYYQRMIIQYLLQLASCIDIKLQSNLFKISKTVYIFYRTCVNTFHGLTKICKSKIIESATNTQNSEIIDIFEPNDL